MTTDSLHIKQIATRELKGAKMILGEGWHHVSDEIRWGLFCAGILGAVAGQHALSDEKATTEELASVARFTQEIWDVANAIRNNGWR